MATAQRIIPNLYRDSVSLMQFSEKIAKLPGVRQASAVMATENNIGLLVEAGLLASASPPSPNDLLIVVEAEETDAAELALDKAENTLKQKPTASLDSEARKTPPRSIEMGLAEMPGANLALISTPGDYAAAEALKALRLGLHVMLFSANVSVDDEVMLKRYAREHNLLVMGPDCGTAIINGAPLGFANVVRRGDIGIVAASGTGLQQVASLIHRYGGGITQAIGIGGHDLSARVGGISMLQGIDALAVDPGTKVIVLISKPPAPNVMKVVLDKAACSGKPVVVDFLGADPASFSGKAIHGVKTLEDASATAVALAAGKPAPNLSDTLSPTLTKLTGDLRSQLAEGQKYVRGLFSGGTLCFETLLLLGESLGEVYSNSPLQPEFKLPDVWKSQKHMAIDLGDDLFTQGRPHPMIDFRLRNERMAQEARDPEVAVILLDVVLGYGSHMDPAGELLPAITEARLIAEKAGRKIVFIGSVCGTDSDPQNLPHQEQMLREAGVHLVDSNAKSARLAAAIVNPMKA